MIDEDAVALHSFTGSKRGRADGNSFVPPPTRKRLDSSSDEDSDLAVDDLEALATALDSGEDEDDELEALAAELGSDGSGPEDSDQDLSLEEMAAALDDDSDDQYT